MNIGKNIPFIMASAFCFVSLPVAYALDITVPLAANQINLNPTKLYDQSSLWISRHIHCQLSRKQQGNIVLEAAASLEYENPRRLKVTLGSQYLFYDGSPITSQDVVASFEFLKSNRPSYKAQFNLVDRVDAVDMKTLVFQFKEPTAKLFLDFFSASQNPILPKKYLEKVKTSPNLLDDPIGCGNYKIEKYVRGDSIDLVPVRNTLNSVKFSLQSKNQISEAELEKFDLVPLQIPDLDRSKPNAARNFQELKLFDPYHIVLGLNSRRSPWTSEENRCALFSRLNPSAPRGHYGPDVTPANDLFPKGVLGHNPSSNFQHYYKSRQNRLPDLSKRPFCVSFVAASIPEFRRPAFVEMLKEQYPKVKIVEIIDPKEFGTTFLSQKCDALVIGFKSNNLDGADFLNVFAESAVNYTGYWDDNIMSDISRAQSLEEPSRRAEIYRSLSTDIRDKCLIYPILTIPYKSVFVRSRLDFPELGKSFLNEYYLGNVREKK